ncbi:TPA: hypothetical protein HH294_14035 [Xanthomonas vasicola pv. zeae]|nr:hypothetical protein [Xanthomonas vasicola pv. zeae]HHZ51502.1 hypothetical protein [Xanthomonas vasicola pv. zeae]
MDLPCAHAGQATTPGEKSEFYSALSLATPVLIASGVVASVVGGPLAASTAVAESRREARAGKLPPMRVEAVDTLPAGARQVRLQEPQQAENTAVLQWQVRQDDPAAGFHVGEIVTFQPGRWQWLDRACRTRERIGVRTDRSRCRVQQQPNVVTRTPCATGGGHIRSTTA